MHHLFQPRAFPPEFLGALRIVPDGGVFEFPADLGQAFNTRIEVKDTP
jgi:hypothetical protein